MNGKKIVIGEHYRYAHGRLGTYFQRVKVLRILDVSKWDRKTMKYTTVPGKVEIEFDGGSKSEARFQDIIELWSEFKTRDPKKAASYHYSAKKQAWEVSRRDVLAGYAAAKVGVDIDSPPNIGSTYSYSGKDPYYVSLRMTMDQYFAYVGKTREEYDAEVGPAPEMPANPS